MNTYNKIQAARDPKRLVGRQLIDIIADNFIELHGDRYYGDDKAIVGGIGTINGKPYTLIAQQKGSELDERVDCNFGMAQPEGFRKAHRLIQQAEKFGRPVITIVDTAGAYPGIEAEERGQASAIANMLYMLSDVKVPVITIILSEGGSGGALALAISDHIFMFENAFYSVISPEGFASILYKGERKVEDVVDSMKIMPEDMLRFGIIDEIIKEPKVQLNVETYQFQSEELKEKILKVTEKKEKLPMKELIKKRSQRLEKVEKNARR